MAKNKQEITLDNDEVVEVGASKEITGEETVLITGWNPGQAPHFSVPFGVLTELIANGKLETVGDYDFNDTTTIPVVKAEDVLNLVKGAVEKENEIEWKVTRVGGSNKKLKALSEAAIEIIMDINKCTREKAVAQIKDLQAKKAEEEKEEDETEETAEEVEEETTEVVEE